MDYWLRFLTVVMVVMLADGCWTMYFIKTEERLSHQAGIWSALIILCSSVVTTHYIHDTSLVVAAMIGAYVGTTAIVEWKRRKEIKLKKDDSPTPKMLLND